MSSISDGGKRGIGFVSVTGNGTPMDGLASLPLPDEPTDTIPGSLDKLRVMAERLAGGRSLFHPLDRKDYS